MDKEITIQEKRFCYEYLVDKNATAAYIRAGYTANYNTAKSNASKLLKTERVSEFYNYLVEERNSRTELNAEKVVMELAKIAFFDARNIKLVEYHEDGTFTSRLKDLSEMDPQDSAAISEITERQVHRDDDAGITVIDRKYKMHSKSHALEQLGKHVGIYEKDNNQKKFAEVNFYLPKNGREADKNSE